MLIRAWTQHRQDAPPVLEDLELDDPRDDEVLVRVVAAAVCHTDLFAPALVDLPAVFGHEGSGIVEAVGAAVRKVRPGDRVAMTFGSCGRCRSCADAAPAYCWHSHELNMEGRRLDGSLTLRSARGPVRGAFFQQSCFATHSLCTERNVVKVPDGFPLDLAAPLGCGVQTGVGSIVNVLDPPPASSVVIFGAGSVGLSAVMGAVLARCESIIAVDVLHDRLALARELGATHAIDAGAGHVVDSIQELTRGGATYSVETAGTVQSFTAAIDCLVKRGVCALVTVPEMGRPIAFSPLAILRGRSLVGVLEGDSNPDQFIPWLMEQHLAGRLPYDRLCRRYAFDDLPLALADSAAGRVIKPIIVGQARGDTLF